MLKTASLLAYPQRMTVLVAFFLGSCSLFPGVGPSKSKIEQLNQAVVTPNLPPVAIIDINSSTINQFTLQQNQTFSSLEQSNTQAAQDLKYTIGNGDILQINIWEAAPALLFSNTALYNESGASGTVLPAQMVNEKGEITIPFLGQIKVTGLTPTQVQTLIRNKLQPKANFPQVLVQVKNNNSSNVIVLRNGGAIRMPLTAHGETILDAVAAIGGVNNNAEDISVQVTRQHQVKTIPLLTLVRNPNENIRLQAGDVVYLLNNPLSITALGAIGKNSEIKFSAQGITLSQALARIGGLINTQSDARGIFIFRYVPLTSMSVQEQQGWLAKGYSTNLSIPTVYRLDLSNPQSFFWIQKFAMHHQDIVYVSNAPLTELNKFLTLVYGATNPVYNIIRSFDILDNN